MLRRQDDEGTVGGPAVVGDVVGNAGVVDHIGQLGRGAVPVPAEAMQEDEQRLFRSRSVAGWEVFVVAERGRRGPERVCGEPARGVDPEKSIRRPNTARRRGSDPPWSRRESRRRRRRLYPAGGPVGGHAGNPKHHLTGRVLHDEALARVFARNFEDVASDRRCLHVLELAVAWTTNHRPVAGSVVTSRRSSCR